MARLKGCIILFSVSLFLFSINNSIAQDLLFIQDSLTLNSGLELSVKGGIKLEGNAILQNNGKIYIKTDTAFGGENWINNVGTNLMNGTGKVIFMSAEQQLIGGSDTSNFFDLEIANTSANGVRLEKSIVVEDTLFLIDGIINTDTNKIIVINPDSAAISDYQQGAITPSFINGNLRRYVDSLNTRYGFPVGRNGVYYLQEIKINSINGIIEYFDSGFDTLVNHSDIELVVVEDGRPYYTVCNDGVWYLTPDQQPNSVSYDCWAYIGNFTNCNLQDNNYTILKRPVASLTAADWDCNNCGVGFGLNPDNGDGRIISDGYALRKNLNSFSQFGIGKMVCSRSINLGNDTILCYGETLSLSADSGLTYLWNNGLTSQTMIVDSTNSYYIAISDSQGCIGSDTINVVVLTENIVNNTLRLCEGDSIFLGGIWQNLSGTYNDSLFSVYGCDSVLVTDLIVNPLPVVNISQDTTIEIGRSCALEAEGGTSYLWNNGDNTSSITVYPQQNTIYVVSVTDIYGCTSKDSVLINVVELVDIFIPNAITPNGDGKNDSFFIRGIENFPDNQLIIYNRWGNRIFESTSYQNNWKGDSQIIGEALPNGTYYYILKLNDEKHNTYTGYIEIVK